jgi:hypothetical protein
MTSLAVMFPGNDPARHTLPMTDAQIIDDQQREIATLREQLRLERESHERTRESLTRETGRGSDRKAIPANAMIRRRAHLADALLLVLGWLMLLAAVALLLKLAI